jgi:peptidoglycan/LPS O-acetylase OafA/YrhL
MASSTTTAARFANLANLANSAASPRNPGLDTLRALAIVLVVLHHYVLFVSGESTFGPVGDVGWIGVDLFFALSGYLIGNQIFAALRSPAGLPMGQFYVRRLLRTVPNFYVVLALFALWPWLRAGQELPPLWRFLSFTQNINLMPGTAFSHAWSLCIEEQFYLLLPACALLLAPARRSPAWTWLALGAVVAGGLAARAAFWHGDVEGQGNNIGYYRYIYYSSLCRLDELVAGVALALIRNHHPRLWRGMTGGRARGYPALAAGLALVLSACAWFLADRYALAVNLFGFPMLGLGFALLIVSALSEGALLRMVPVPGAQALALWSYAIYLTHKQIGILAAGPLERAGLPLDGWAAIMAVMGMSLLAGWLLYRCVELPFMALRERRFPVAKAGDQVSITTASRAAAPR